MESPRGGNLTDLGTNLVPSDIRPRPKITLVDEINDQKNDMIGPSWI